MSIILRETSDSLYIALSHIYLAPPDQQGWESISKDFEETWNLPNVLGALDGKHIRIMASPNSGTQFYNYKSHFSLQFLAMCDACYCFTLVDIGSYGSNNDTGVLNNSSFGKRFASGTMNIPLPRSVEGCRFDPLPYYIVGDDIFPLKEWLMKPYPGTSLTVEERIFNYRITRCRRVIENAFGILVARFRILHTPICASIENAESYVKVAVALHNYLRQTENTMYTPVAFIDNESSDGKFKPDFWSEDFVSRHGMLSNFPKLRGYRLPVDASDMREVLKEYTSSEEGHLSWQLEHVTRT